MKRQRCQPDASEGCGDGAKAAPPQARKRPAPFCPPLIRAVPAAATSYAADATGAPTAAAAATTAPAAKAVPTPGPSPISAPSNLRRPSPKRTTSSASLPSPSVPAAQPAAGRAPSVPGLRRQLGPPTLARAQASMAAAHQPMEAEATRGGSHCPARKTPEPRPRTTGAAPMPSVSRAAAKPPRESDVAAAAAAVEAQGRQGPTHMAGSVSGAARSYDDAGGARIAGVAAVKELDTVQSDQSPSGSTEPRGAAGSNSDHAAGDSPEREQHVGTDAAEGALAGDGATPQPATASRRQSVADEEAPAERRVMSTRTPAPPTPTPPAGTSSNAAGVSAHTGETAAATAAHGPSLSPSPAPALLRAAESQLRRERASAPAPAVPADPSPLPPQRASPCVSGRRSGVTPSTSATTEQEQRRLAEQLPRLLSPMLALDEVAQPQWVSPLPPLLQPSQPQQQGQEEEEEAQEDEQDEEREAPAAMPSRQPGRGEAAPAAPGAAAATQSGAAGAGRSSNGAAAAEEVAISRLPVKELVPLEPPQLPESASGSSPFSQLMRVLPLSRLLAPLPPGAPPQLRVASAAAARGVQGALRLRKALAVHTPPLAQPSTSSSQPGNDPTVAEAAGAAVRSLLLQGGGTGSRAGAGGGASGGGGGAGGSDVAAVGRGQHLRQAMRLARILAAARCSTLRAFRPPPAPPRPIQAAMPDSSCDDASGGQVSAAGDGEEDACEVARLNPDPEALAACAPGGSVTADGARAGEDTIRRRRPSGEMEGMHLQSELEPMASEAWPLEALELQPPSQSDAALRPQRDRGALAAAGDGGAGVQGSGAERGAQKCVSAAAAGDGAVEMESCADSPPSGDGVVDESRQRTGGVAMPAAAEQGGVGGGGACGEQHTAWSGLSLEFLADVFNA